MKRQIYTTPQGFWFDWTSLQAPPVFGFYKRFHQLLVLTLFIIFPLLLFCQLLETSPSGVFGDSATPPVGLVPKLELVPVPIPLQ